MPIIDEEYCKNLLLGSSVNLDEEKPAEEELGDKAFAKILRLTGVRDRSTKELRERLIKDGFDESVVEDALDQASRCGLLDDIRFGETLIRSRKNAGKGKNGIEYELERHNIDVLSIPGWPEEYFPSDESEVEGALAFLNKKPPTAKNKRDAAYRKLISKGYSSAIASRAARMWFEGLN